MIGLPAGGVPDFLTVEEAAGVLRIGRTSAYQLAREYLLTGGAAGLPVVRVGKLLRVPRVHLERLLGGPLTSPLRCAGCEPSELTPVAVASVSTVPAPRSRVEQASLPFPG